MTRGRKRIPLEVKIAQGTIRSDRDGDPDLAPQATAITECPPPAPDLLGKGREVWLETLPLMIQAGYFTSLDMGAFQRYCAAHDGIVKCEVAMQMDGEFSCSDAGVWRTHPAAEQKFRWLEFIRRYEEAFWLTPTARSGKQIAGGKTASSIPKRSRA